MKRIGKTLFRKKSDKMRKELEDAAREGGSRRSNSPVPAMPALERTGSLSDLTGNAAKVAGFYSDGIPKNIHMKFVRMNHFIQSIWLPITRTISQFRTFNKYCRMPMMEK